MTPEVGFHKKSASEEDTRSPLRYTFYERSLSGPSPVPRHPTPKEALEPHAADRINRKEFEIAMPEHPSPSAFRAGFWATLGAFLLWGALPIYWKALEDISPLEILCHRILWSMLMLLLLLSATHRWHEVRSALSQRRIALGLFASSAIIGVNWLTYIWAVNSGKILESSLGYFITPLVNVLFGMIFFHERLRPFQWAAVALAALGVGYQLLLYGSLPWVSLLLAVTFGSYGLLRKKLAVASIPGLFVETLLLSAPALAYLGFLALRGQLLFGTGPLFRDALLTCAGVITSVPLLLFAFGAARIPLITVGLLQYASPSLSFALGVLVYGEVFDVTRGVTFGAIWLGLGLYTLDAFLWSQRRPSPAPQEPPSPQKGA